MRRARYIAIGFAMDLMLGTAYAWSVVSRPLREVYGASEFEAMLPSAVALAGFAVGMTPGGRWVERFGPRRTALVGSLLFGVGYVLSSLLGLTPWPLLWLTLTYGVVLGVDIGVTYSATLTTAVRWYPDRKGLASGLVVMGFGLSALVTGPLLAALIEAYGISGGFAILGTGFLAGLLALSLKLSMPPAGFAPPIRARPGRKSVASTEELEPRAMVRTSAFWTAWLLYALGTAAGFMVINKALPIAEETGGASGPLAMAAVQLLAVFNCIGRPSFGRLADRFGPREAAEALAVVLLLGLSLMVFARNIVVLYLGIGLVGMVFGGFLAVMPSLASHYFGSAKLAVNYGLLFTGYGFGSVVALFSIGPLRDTFGSYVPAFWLAMAFAAASLLLALMLRPPRAAARRVAVPAAS